MNLHKENIREIKSLIKEYGLVTFGSAVYDLYSEGNLVLPERLSRQVEEAEPDKPDFTDWGGQIIKAVGSGELTFTEDELNTIWSFCENPSWMYNKKGKRINEIKRPVRLNEAQLKQLIKEAVEKALEGPTDYGEFTDVMDFLTPFFDKWGWKYTAKLEDHKTANCLLIRFKHRLGASTCARLCAEINSHLEWSEFSNYKCLWGVNEKTHTFSFELWEKHYDNNGNRIK